MIALRNRKTRGDSVTGGAVGGDRCGSPTSLGCHLQGRIRHRLRRRFALLELTR
jgi:hypothetical protein